MEFLSVNIAVEKNALFAQEILARLRAKLDSIDSGAADFLAPRLWSLEDGLETFYHEVDQTRYDVVNKRVKGKGYETRQFSRIDEKNGSLLILVIDYDTINSTTDRKKLIESLEKLKTRFVGVVVFALSDRTLEFPDVSFPKRLAYDFSALFEETWIRVVVASSRTRSDGNYVNVEEEQEIVVDAIAEELVVNAPKDINQGVFRLEPPDSFSFEVLGGRVVLRNDEELAKALASRYVGDALDKIALQNKETPNGDFKTLEETPSEMLRRVFEKNSEVELDYLGNSIDELLESVVFPHAPETLFSEQNVDEILSTINRRNASYEQNGKRALEKADAQLSRRVKLETDLWRKRFMKALLSKESLQTLEVGAKKSVQSRFRTELIVEEPNIPGVDDIKSLVAAVPSAWSKTLPVLCLGLFIFALLPLIYYLVSDSFSLEALGVGTLALVVSCCVGRYLHGTRQGAVEGIVDKAKEKISEFKEYYQASLQKALREKFTEASKKLEQTVDEYARILESIAQKIDEFNSVKSISLPKSNVNKALDEDRYDDFLTWVKTSQSKAFSEDVQTLARIIEAESNWGFESKSPDVNRLVSQMNQTGERRLLKIVKSCGLDVLLRNPFDDPQSGVNEFCRVLTPNDKVFATGALIRQALTEAAQSEGLRFFMKSRIYVSPPKPDMSACQNSQIVVRESFFSNVCVSVQTLTLFFGELSEEERQRFEEIVRDEKEEPQTEESVKTIASEDDANPQNGETPLDISILEKTNDA